MKDDLIMNIFSEWDTGWPGPEVIVEVHEVVTEYQISNITNSTVIEQGKTAFLSNLQRF